jgi:hydrogenase nickel incorporation protein HypB
MTRVAIEKRVLSENDAEAAVIRQRLRREGTLCLNLIGSPGAGKTALLERTLERLSSENAVAVLTGDIQTDCDARRLMRYGHPVRQITTAGACHLDARMVARHLEGWPGHLDLLLIENVGNLVCPTSYDLGEDAKVVLLSVTEGEQKPLKYPGIFKKADLMILTKTDLLPYVSFDLERVRTNARLIHPAIEIIETSATTGAGLDEWIGWLAARAAGKQAQAEREVEHAGR